MTTHLLVTLLFITPRHPAAPSGGAQTVQRGSLLLMPFLQSQLLNSKKKANLAIA
jgi:hypothetical protein